ncbi:restriction endonuclease subunit S [Streptomyces sp. NBC_01795]|uniref:restriction endonuclease subunit S n=1 Tax=Streptomyces sp. NBC_01795 TaxID=2975943 RepID=UPI002DDA3023|nr:restriction endonuclease subunit S [Streptomyces sp. NBC_01795]WSA93334.1 restriction endonuclease subunit S [Streptomyces sp. NBC_01795]
MSDWEQIALGDPRARVHRKVAVPPQGSTNSTHGWRRASLSEVVNRVTTKNVDGTNQNVLTVSAEHGLIAQESFFTKKVASRDTSGYYVVASGQFVYNKSTSKSATYGTVARNLRDEPGIVSPLYFVFEAKDGAALPEYLELALNSDQFFRSLAGMLREGARSHGALNVRVGEFYAATVPLPPASTQERIVEVIGAVDSQIRALDAEAEALDGVYRGFLLALGARCGEVKISEVVSRAFAGGTPLRSKSEFYSGDIPWLKSGEVENDSIVTASEFITEAGLRGSSAKMVPPGATVVAMYGQGDTKGRAGFVKSSISTNQAVLALVPNENVVLPRFLLHAVRSKTGDLRHRAVGSSQPNLSRGLVLTQTVPMPDSLADQEQALAGIDSVRVNQAAIRAEADRLRGVRASLLTNLLNCTIGIESAELEV